ncbi:MAG: Uma2 family endonuclease, partial [Bacteroidia bacterium]|nr:Uma2 family endonuclease [Bacteroidia bacterium]
MQAKILVSVDDYLIAEEQAFHKSEYMAGEVIAMAGVSLKHDLITNRINALLFECLLKRGCKLFSKDVLVRVKEYEAFFYPDIVIACGNIKLFKRPQGAKALLEPTIIMEVLSESASLVDRTTKLRCYQTIPTLQKYILIEQDQILIEEYTRQSLNQWLETIYTQENEVLDILGCMLNVK